MLFKYTILFLIFGFLGWGIDTGYRYLGHGEYQPATIIPFFASLYGIGGVITIGLYKFTNIKVIWQVLLGGIVITLTELFGGLFCTYVLGLQLWDYSQNRFNFLGQIDLLHAFYWFVLAAILRLFVRQGEFVMSEPRTFGEFLDELWQSAEARYNVHALGFLEEFKHSFYAPDLEVIRAEVFSEKLFRTFLEVVITLSRAKVVSIQIETVRSLAFKDCQTFLRTLHQKAKAFGVEVPLAEVDVPLSPGDAVFRAAVKQQQNKGD